MRRPVGYWPPCKTHCTEVGMTAMRYSDIVALLPGSSSSANACNMTFDPIEIVEGWKVISRAFAEEEEPRNKASDVAPALTMVIGPLLCLPHGIYRTGRREKAGEE